jgi:hypothetical protein
MWERKDPELKAQRSLSICYMEKREKVGQH